MHTSGTNLQLQSSFKACRSPPKMWLKRSKFSFTCVSDGFAFRWKAPTLSIPSQAGNSTCRVLAAPATQTAIEAQNMWQLQDSPDQQDRRLVKLSEVLNRRKHESCRASLCTRTPQEPFNRVLMAHNSRWGV